LELNSFFLLQLADSLDVLQQSANELKSSNIAVKRRARAKKTKLNSETGEGTSNRVKFVRRSSRIIQEKRYEVIYLPVLICTYIIKYEKLYYSEL